MAVDFLFVRGRKSAKSPMFFIQMFYRKKKNQSTVCPEKKREKKRAGNDRKNTEGGI